jgi:hypothetical protein
VSLVCCYKEVLTGLYQIKEGSDPADWPIPEDPYKRLAESTGCKPVKVFNPVTGDFEIFETPSDCARILGIKPTTLNERLKSRGQKTYSDGWNYCYYSDIV